MLAVETPLCEPTLERKFASCKGKSGLILQFGKGRACIHLTMSRLGCFKKVTNKFHNVECWSKS